MTSDPKASEANASASETSVSKPDASDRQRLPFEPGTSRKSSRKKENPPAAAASRKAQSKPQAAEDQSKPSSSTSNSPQERARQILSKKDKVNAAKSGKSTSDVSKRDRSDVGIPEVISRRMVSRMMVLCGIPSAMGILVFLIAFQLVSNDWVKLPNVAVLLASMGCFGLGVVGLSYGALSASWDEDKPGSWLGFAEFSVNWQRMTAAWAETREKQKARQQQGGNS